jgi:seryl-tRNA synthetase
MTSKLKKRAERLSKEVRKYKSAVDKAEGQLEAAMKRLANIGRLSIEDAERMATRLRRKEAGLAREVAEMCEELEKEVFDEDES